MKIRLMTFHTPKNYGAVLQAYSLMSYLSRNGDDVKLIDYNTPALRAKYPIIPKGRGVKHLAYTLIMLPTYGRKRKKYQKFDAFVQHNFRLTERYESLAGLTSAPPEADAVITGSDQVFNPSRIAEERKAFYLDFVPEGVRRISYAASFGMSAVPEDRREEIAAYLQKFDAISVRESTGIGIVRALSGKTAVEVLDPVFLNDKSFWRGVEKPYRKDFGRYLFYYRLMGAAGSDDIARKIAAEKKLKLVVMTDGLMRWKADRVLRDVGPEEFLYLTDHADFVVTDSFHGVAFSLLFEKQFAFSDGNPATRERGVNLLRAAGLEHAATGAGEGQAPQLDYTGIHERLAGAENASRAFLTEALRG